MSCCYGWRIRSYATNGRAAPTRNPAPPAVKAGWSRHPKAVVVVLVDYQVTTTREGEYVHVTAEADPDNPRTHRWLWRPYAAEEGLFTPDTARQFFGVTCGMSERTRNRVVDQIDFTIEDDPDPDPDTDRVEGK